MSDPYMQNPLANVGFSAEEQAQLSNAGYAQSLPAMQNQDDLRFYYWGDKIHRLPLTMEEKLKVLAIVDAALQRMPNGTALR